jgi:hypothetical protein
MHGWLTFPLGRGLRLGVSPTRSWLSFPLFRCIRGGNLSAGPTLIILSIRAISYANAVGFGGCAVRGWF